jgi:hypothetical protein
MWLLAAACSSAASAPQTSAPATPVTQAPAPARATGRVVRARVIAAVDDAAASEAAVHARKDQHVTLYALIELDDGKFFSDAPNVRGKQVQPLVRGPDIMLRWTRIEPAAASYSNTEGGQFHFEQIEYRATAIDGARAGSLVADVRPTLTPDHGGGVGTMRYQVVVTQGDREIASPGVDARRGRGSGGLTDDVLRVSIRRDDTYLGYLTELYGQPYVWASAGITDATHQSERLEGADCADFVVYGARRMGKKYAYTWTGGLPDISTLLAAGTRDDHGVYRDKHGDALPFTRVGDLVLFPRHVGVLVEDRGAIGVLDDQDIIMHALFDTPKQVPIADSGYADKPLELRRFK